MLHSLLLVAALAQVPSSSYADRVHTVRGLTRSSTAAAHRTLAETLTTDPDDIVRAEAATVLGTLPQSEATASLLAGLRDGSPRVRDAAILALAGRRDFTMMDALVPLVRSDPWPFVRRDALELLARDCTPTALPHLRALSERTDEDEDVRRTALVALARCQKSQPALLIAIAKNPKEEASLREQACALLADLPEAIATPSLLQLLESRELRRKEDEPLLASCMARLGGVAAKETTSSRRAQIERLLVSKLQSAASESIQVAAAQALGELCSNGASAPLQNASQRAAAAPVRRAALASQRRCQAQRPVPPPEP